MGTYALNQTWSGAGFQLSLSGDRLLKSTQGFLATPLTMASSFVGVPVDLGALIVKRVFQDRTDPLEISDDILHEIQIIIRGYSLFDRPCWTIGRQCYTKKLCTYCCAVCLCFTAIFCQHASWTCMNSWWWLAHPGWNTALALSIVHKGESNEVINAPFMWMRI